MLTLLPVLLLLAALLCLPGAATAQIPPKPPAPAPAAPAAAPKPPEQPPAPQPIAISDIAIQAEAALSEVRQLENRGRIEDVIQTATDRLPLLERETGFRVQLARRLNRVAFSLESIQNLEEELRDIELRTAPVRRDLTRTALQVDRDLKELERLEAIWNVTIKAASDAAAPADVLDRAKDLSRTITDAKKSVLDDRAKVLALQGRATDIGTQLADIRRMLADASERAVTRLLYRDSAPLWTSAFWAAWLRSFSVEAGENLVNQAVALGDYARTHARNFIFHAGFLGLLVIALSAARSRVNSLCESDEGLKRNRQIYDMPVVTALLLSMLFSTWFYPRPPRALWLMMGVLASAPLLVFARRMVDVRLYPLLSSVVIFYLLDRVRALFAPLPGVHRFMLLVEALGLVLVIVTALRQHARGALLESRAAARTIHYGSWALLLLSAIVLACNAGGYARLADLVMRTTLASAYTGAVLYVLTRAGEGLMHGLLYLPPLSFLAGVRRHRARIAMRINRWTQWLAFLLWVTLTLQATGFLQQAIGWSVVLWKASLDIGSLNLAVSDIVLFILILWTTYQLSRLSRFFLEEEIFSRVRLDRGLPYAVSTTVHYIILLTGFVLALTAIGVDMTKFTIVAGALTVGIGFGLQNIVNNFVSGLIVLFERPVKVGDTVEIDNIVGRVQHIGIRATVIHSTTGAEVIIPNGKLISDKVTNWTLSSQLRQIAVPVVTKPDINVARLKSTLLEVSRWNKQVLETPAPDVLFIKRGVDAFEFELRVWTSDLDAWLKVRSDLISDINDALSNQDLPAQAPGTQETLAPPGEKPDAAGYVPPEQSQPPQLPQPSQLPPVTR
ncbi:mechanosensitive ion channel family protein [Noviherbaspirillum aerium]|uniref:mechanosensitive ion channel family protein n=1 Tax=Noviherbaspirillum aerium TaxID=2588497 RepID=UPI00178C2BAA|nr:mechanosensitive ion channel domain-containing protein [Noviherbaspirillum aerium]